MHKDRIPGNCSAQGTELLDRELAKWQVRVLSLVLSEQPDQLTRDEIARELLGGSSEFAEQDALMRAISALAIAGLLHEIESLVLPTRAALHFYRLELE